MRRSIAVSIWMASVALLSLGLVVGTAGEAQACSCMVPPPAEEALKEADAVFVGQVLGGEAKDRMTLEVRLAVERRWKGAESEEITVRTATSGAACGFSFTEGERYLVYGYEHEGVLQVSLCSRTAPLDRAEEDIEALDREVGQAPSETRQPETSQPETSTEREAVGFPAPQCQDGERLLVEKWGCVMRVVHSGDQQVRYLSGNVAPQICRWKGMPVVESWQCMAE